MAKACERMKGSGWVVMKTKEGGGKGYLEGGGKKKEREECSKPRMGSLTRRGGARKKMESKSGKSFRGEGGQNRTQNRKKRVWVRGGKGWK